jgi:hypothetical protein
MLHFAAVLTLSGVGASSPARVAPDFSWHRALAAGKTIEIVGVNGSIDANGTSGNEVEVSAVKRGHRSDPESVQFEVVEHANGVTICAVYPSAGRGEANECRPGGKSHMNTRNNDVEVTWTVRVPRGILFEGRTVNGDVTALGLTAKSLAHTVNGSISLETSSWASASTVNGSISAKLGSTEWTGDNEFSTVNGGITLDLPTEANLDVDASTVNGSMSTDFPLTIKGRWGPRRMNGVIGKGGASLSLSTVNGAVELRRRDRNP